jgi:hypothetical protein
MRATTSRLAATHGFAFGIGDEGNLLGAGAGRGGHRVDENPDAAPLQIRHASVDVLHLQAEVMQAGQLHQVLHVVGRRRSGSIGRPPISSITADVAPRG